MIQKPLDLLKSELKELEKALHKSFIAYQEGRINSELHEKHKENLNPAIFEYKRIIQLLEQFSD